MKHLMNNHNSLKPLRHHPLMKTTSSKDSIYIGKNAGGELWEYIKNARHSLKIVSPYLSPNYIKELISLHNKGVKITLITADEIEVNQYSDFKHSDIIKQKKVDNPNAKHNKKISYLVSFSFLLISILSSILYLISSSLILYKFCSFILSK